MVEIIIMSEEGGGSDRQAVNRLLISSSLWTTRSSLRGKIPAERIH